MGRKGLAQERTTGILQFSGWPILVVVAVIGTVIGTVVVAVVVTVVVTIVVAVVITASLSSVVLVAFLALFSTCGAGGLATHGKSCSCETV